MELVYLWVEKYKNIEKQGFNFSPRFECKFYDEYETYTDENGEIQERLKDNCELVICDKKKNETLDKDTKACKPCKENDFIDNFFGDNINVTAIVGKNGSGKSSVWEVIDSITSQIELNIKYIFLYKQINNLEYISNIKLNTVIQKTSIFSSNNILFYKNHNSFPNNYQVYTQGSTRNINLDTISSILIKVRNIEKTMLDLDIENIIFIPSKVKIKLKDNEQLRHENLNYFLSLKDKKKASKYFLEIKSIIGRLFFIDIIQHNEIRGKEIDEIFYFIKNILLGNHCYYSYVYRCKNNNNKIKNFLNINKYRQKLDRKKIIKYIFNLKSNKKYKLSDLSDEEIDIYFNPNDILQRNKTFILFDIEFFDKKDRTFKNLSDGEQILLAIKLYIFNNIGTINKHNYLNINTFSFIFDEIETALHPLWQKKLIKELTLVINKYKTQNDKIHLIFTTHSPFLLSDIPKQNIIFLDTYKEEDEEVKNGIQKVGNCKVVDGLNDKKQTFGANIHTLLNDSFFMEDGLMGEFAKNKIRTIKVAHRYVLHKHKRKILFTQSCKRCRRLLIKRLPKFWQIQNIIGEPFLQKIVKNQIEEIELILLGKDEAIDKEISRLQALKEGR